MSDFLIYTQPACSWCDQAKELLINHSIPFEVRDITDPRNRNEFLELGARTVPLIFKGDRRIGGYLELEELLSDQ